MNSPQVPLRKIRPRRRGALILAAAAIALALGMAVGHLKSHPPESSEGSPEAAARLQTLTLNTPTGKPEPLAQWQGKIRVLNFWATWCPPCREEIPALSRTQTKLAGKGVQFLGIAVDSADNVRDFIQEAVRETPLTYPLLIASPEAIESLKALGNRQGGLPFTVILDRQGQIRYARLGGLDESKLERLLAPLLTP